MHTYNGEFSVENDELKKENLQLRHSVASLKKKYEELKAQDKVCPQCEALARDKQRMEAQTQVVNAENVELRNDIEMMKILVYR